MGPGAARYRRRSAELAAGIRYPREGQKWRDDIALIARDDDSNKIRHTADGLPRLAPKRLRGSAPLAPPPRAEGRDVRTRSIHVITQGRFRLRITTLDGEGDTRNRKEKKEGRRGELIGWHARRIARNILVLVPPIIVIIVIVIISHQRSTKGGGGNPPPLARGRRKKDESGPGGWWSRRAGDSYRPGTVPVPVIRPAARRNPRQMRPTGATRSGKEKRRWERADSPLPLNDACGIMWRNEG